MQSLKSSLAITYESRNTGLLVQPDQNMRGFAFLVALFAAFSSFAADAANSLQQFSPRFSTYTKIVWGAPTNHLSKTFWIYKRLPSRPFSATVISNAVALASMQDKKIP